MYKFSDETGLVVECENVTNITPGSPRMWRKYRLWVAQGGVPQPFESDPDDVISESEE